MSWEHSSFTLRCPTFRQLFFCMGYRRKARSYSCSVNCFARKRGIIFLSSFARVGKSEGRSNKFLVIDWLVPRKRDVIMRVCSLKTERAPEIIRKVSMIHFFDFVFSESFMSDRIARPLNIAIFPRSSRENRWQFCSLSIVKKTI